MQAGIPYTAATGEKLVNETFGPNNIHRKTSGTQEWHAMEVRDGRQGRAPSIKRTFFSSARTWIVLPTAVYGAE
jgi:hypothetical protein